MLPAEQPQGLSPAGVLRWAVDLLQQQAAGRRIVLAVDDAHLLDPPSAALVHLVARAENATVIGTLRDGEQVPLPIRALWTDGLVDHVELAPLGLADTTGLLAAITEGPVDPCSADRLWQLSGGNPLLLRELVMAAPPSELSRTYGMWRWTGRLTLAPSLTELIDTRIGQLTPGRPRGAGAGRLRRAARAAPAQPGGGARPTWRLAEERGLITRGDHTTGGRTCGWPTRSTAR